MAAAHEAGAQLSLHGGGLWAEPTRLLPAKAAYIRESDARIAAITGQTFGAPYFGSLLADPAATFWSQPTIAAVLAAGRVRADAELAMLHAIQTAHYVEGRRVSEPAVLADLAARIGLGSQAFEQALDTDGTVRHIQATRSLTDRAGIRGFPGFLLEDREGTRRLPHESYYGRPSDFVAAIRNALWQRVG